MAADRYIVVYLRSIPVRLSKMPAHKSLTLHWRSFWDMVTILSLAYLPRMVAESTIVDHRGRMADRFSKIEGLISLMLRWRSFSGHSNDVVQSIVA